MRRLVLAAAVLSLSACDLITGVPVEANPAACSATNWYTATDSTTADSVRVGVGYCVR